MRSAPNYRGEVRDTAGEVPLRNTATDSLTVYRFVIIISSLQYRLSFRHCSTV